MDPWEYPVKSQLIAEECSRREDTWRGYKMNGAAVTGWMHSVYWVCKPLVTEITSSKAIPTFMQVAGSCLSTKEACAWGVVTGTETAIHVCRPWATDQLIYTQYKLKAFLHLGPMSGSHKPGLSDQSSSARGKWSGAQAIPLESNMGSACSVSSNQPAKF